MRVCPAPPPGLIGDPTSWSAKGAYRDGSHVWFVDGQAEIMPGWESFTTTPLTGVCRAVFA